MFWTSAKKARCHRHLIMEAPIAGGARVRRVVAAHMSTQSISFTSLSSLALLAVLTWSTGIISSRWSLSMRTKTYIAWMDMHLKEARSNLCMCYYRYKSSLSTRFSDATHVIHCIGLSNPTHWFVICRHSRIYFAWIILLATMVYLAQNNSATVKNCV
jgi:hypothetical protein